MPPKKAAAKTKELNTWTKSVETQIEKIQSDKGLFDDQSKITKYFKDATFSTSDAFTSFDNIKLLVDKAEKQKISEDNELLKNLREIYTSIEAIREETEKEVANSVNVTKARELMEKILESGVIFEEYNVMKAMFEKKPKAKQVGVKSRSQKITDSQVLRELIEECDKDSDVLDEATKELLIEKKQVILDWLDGKKDFNANKIDDITRRPF